jgi:hypothetical protein
MRPFERRQNATRDIRAFFIRAAWALALFIVMIICVHAAWDMYNRFATAQTQEEFSREQLANLSQRKSEVQAAVASFSTDRGMEAEVRERYGVARPGEGKIEIVHNNAAAATSSTPKTENIILRFIRALFVW